MQLGQKVLIVEDNIIGTVFLIHHGQVTKVKVGGKIINVVNKTVKVLPWILQIIVFFKQFIK